jgi:hypothetical protein
VDHTQTAWFWLLKWITPSGDDARAQINFPRHGLKWLALRAMKSVPAARVSRPNTGQREISDLATKRQWLADSSSTMSSHEIWLATSSTEPCIGATPLTSTLIATSSNKSCAHALTWCAFSALDRRGNPQATNHRPRSTCSVSRISRSMGIRDRVMAGECTKRNQSIKMPESVAKPRAKWRAVCRLAA